MTTDKPQCLGKIHDEGRWGGFYVRQCTKSAQVGKQYCKTHDPEIRAAKHEIEEKACRAEWDKARELNLLFDGLDLGFPVCSAKAGQKHRVVFNLTEDQIRQLATVLRIS